MRAASAAFQWTQRAFAKEAEGVAIVELLYGFIEHRTSSVMCHREVACATPIPPDDRRRKTERGYEMLTSSRVMVNSRNRSRVAGG